MALFESVTDLNAQRDLLARGRWGVIHVVEGRLDQVRLRPLPTMVSRLEAALAERLSWGRGHGDRCRLHYDQPLLHANFLAVKYFVAGRGTTLASLRVALGILDEIARIKRSDALLCEVTNLRISDRMLVRAGWERHCLASRGRHYIRRFYGEYPEPAVELTWGSSRRGGSSAASRLSPSR